jgi:hypothetical protein
VSPEDVAREMEAWKQVVAVLLGKERRCRMCAKAAKLNAGTTRAPICAVHQQIRGMMALSDR